MAGEIKAAERKIRYYLGHVFQTFAGDNGHSHDVAEDGTIDCPDCATAYKILAVGTPEAAPAQAAGNALNPAEPRPVPSVPTAAPALPVPLAPTDPKAAS